MDKRKLRKEDWDTGELITNTEIVAILKTVGVHFTTA